MESEYYIYVLQLLDTVIGTEHTSSEVIVDIDDDNRSFGAYLTAVDTMAKIKINKPIHSMEDIKLKLIQYLISTRRLGRTIKVDNILYKIEDGVHVVIYRDRGAYIEPLYRFRRVN